MINSGLGTLLVLLILLLVAIFGYYRGFMVLLTRRAALTESRVINGWPAVLLGLLQLGAAVAASAVAVLFYFSQVR